MFEQLMQFNSVGLFALRLVIGIIFFIHALPKLKNAKGMAIGMGMPAAMIMMLGSVEILASLGLVLGVYLQLAALLLGLVMVGALGMKMMKWHVPFMAMDKTGWEFDLLLLVANLALLLGGGGSIGIR